MVPKLADPKLYHLEPKGFWKTVHSKLSANPRISSGLPLPTIYRNPAPGSRPEPYATPATAASDPAFNPYWKRDTRRAYPQISTVSQSHLANLLLASPEGQAALPQPKEDVDPSTALTASSTPSTPSYPVVLAAIHEAASPVYSKDRLPPAPPSFGTQVGPRQMKRVGDVPHDLGDYMHMHA